MTNLDHTGFKSYLAELAGRFQSFQLNQGVLYHYTNTKALLSILEHQKIWVSKCNFLSDFLEIEYTKKLLRLLLEEKNAIELWKDIKELLNQRNHQIQLFILSLTTKQDSLPLWASYSSSEGYNLGFELVELFKVFLHHQFVFSHGRVIYDEELQKSILAREVDQLLSGAGKTTAGSGVGEDDRKMARFLAVVMFLAVLFKKPCFKDEKEYRVIFWTGDQVTRQIKINYRAQDDAIIPYIEIPLALPGQQMPLRQITIGPKNNREIAEIGLLHFLEYQGLNDVEVLKSEIPLR